MPNDSSMSMIARASLITGSAALIASAITLVRNRIIATLQGTEGIGLLGQFMSLQALIAGIAALGLATGLIKYLSQYLESREYDRISKSFSSAAIMVVFSSAIAAAVLILLSGWISSLLVGDNSAQLYVVIIAVSMPVASLTSIYNSLVNGARAIKPLARISVYSSLGALIVAVPTVYFLGTVGIIVQIATASGVSFVLNFAVGRRIRKTWPVTTSLSRFDAEESKLLLHYGVVSVITGLLLPLTLLITQTAVIHQKGLSENGLFTAAWALFWLYIGFATTSVMVYLFPTVSATREHGELSMQVNNGVRFLSIATTPIASVIILVPGVILTILYSSEFTGASRLLQLLAIAGAFRIVSYPVSMALMAKKHLKEYLPIEASFYVVFAGIVVALLPSMGIDAIAIAALAGYIIQAALCVFFVRRILGLFYTVKNWLIFVSSAALLILIFALDHESSILSFAAAAILLPTWLFYATEREERGWFVSKLLRRSH
ncbi:MAG: oligosaccharide flippase family protein [Thermoplasmata archaeon]